MGSVVLFLLGLVAFSSTSELGQEEQDFDTRIAGGFNATRPAPYVTRIQPFGRDGEIRPTCGGALINTTLILTSANCMYGAASAKVLAGTLNPDANATDAGAQFSGSTQIFYHPKFSRNTRDNDIAIIRVDPPFNTTDTVDMIHFAKKPQIMGDKLANKSVLWTSYGMVSEFEDAIALQYALIKPIKAKACKAALTRPPYFVKVPKSAECIQVTATTGICMGDLGSPIVYYNPKDKKHPNRAYLAGLASWNHDMNCPPNTTIKYNTPDWFTRIDPYYKWIHSMGGPKIR